MNIFYLDFDSKKCAQYHCDKHVLKMILEYAQLLSTAKRLALGTLKIVEAIEYIGSYNGGAYKELRKPKSVFVMPEEIYDSESRILYQKIPLATHANHPSAVWVRKSAHNYVWLYNLWSELLFEYEHRYGKNHSMNRLREILFLSVGNCVSFTEPPLAMPDEYKTSDTVESYRNYYRIGKKHIHSWKNRETPEWIVDIP